MIILHPGYPKCASTWLQNAVFTKENGFHTHLPTFENEVIEQFAWTNPVNFDSDLIKRSMLSESSDEKLYISHEALVGDPILGNYWGFEVAARLAAVFKPAKVLLIFREQASYIYSSWSEYVTRGGTNSIDKYALSYKDIKGYRPVLNLDFLKYDELYRQYGHHFGRSNILFLPLELLSKDNKLFIEKLEEFLETDFTRLSKEKKYVGNRGITTSILRHLNRIYIKDPYTPTGSFRYKIIKKLNQWIPDTSHSNYEEKVRHKIREKIKGIYRVSNKSSEEFSGVDLKSLGYDC